MPNWVYNTLTASGDKQEVKRFVDQASKSHVRKYMKYDFDSGEMNWNEETVETDFSFWNFVRPEEEILEEYYGAEPAKSLADVLKFEGNHWYDWNVRNWGCKWDASEIYAEEQDEETRALYEFQTPWGPPMEAFEAMAAQFPELTLELRYEEEQGWGGEAISIEGQVSMLNEWGIPDHEEEEVLA